MTETGRRNRKKAHGLGLRAESLAVGLLRLKGYRILARRYQIREGEIDIVARRGDTVAFVEVKVRPTLDEARTTIGLGKRRRISRAARSWLASNPWAAPLTWRGDAVFLAPWCWPRHEIAVIELDLG
ncbi:YraN family protein [Methylocapsa sp. D3K7]|uniref:YraN family protein n=1 Tax=Methylocapsa sp. D3K7 TaxID=3041435 RepID=UPI00244ED59D|nr:YraN family protein [Methylocapsa sp. D3K7]WGJ13699.1 YraN family protein [Methylocapsa sp. D3K7]